MSGLPSVVSTRSFPALERASRLAARPAAISVFITLARFFSERARLPEAVSFFIGITWLTLIVGAYLGIRLADGERPYRILVLSLLVFSLLSRIPVVVLWWITRRYGLGTHYDVFDGWLDALGAQLVWAAFQVLTGTVLGVAALLLKRRIDASPV